MTASALTLREGQTQGVLVLSASADAPVNANNVTLTGTHDGPNGAVTREVTPAQEIYFPGGGRGLFDVSMQTVAVTEPSDILDVVVTPKEIVLKPGQEVKLEVTVNRKEGFDKGVTLDVLLRHLGRVYGDPLPKGVTVVEAKSKTLLGGASRGHIVLRAAADAAEVEGVPVCVMAQVSVNFVVKLGYSSPAISLSVRK